MRRPQIDPKTLRKHSQIIEKRTEPTMVVGPKEQTDYGFFVDGTKSKAFETKFLTIMPSCMTPTWKHPKKLRVIRVVSGAGLYQAFDEVKTEEAVSERVITDQKMLTVGDELAIQANTIHRITAGPNKLEFYVVQDSKYEAALVEVAPAEVVAQVKQDDLAPMAEADKENKVTMGTDRSMRRSRAAAQIEASRAGRPNLPRGSRGQDAGNFFQQAPGNAGVNVRPVMNFDAEGAG